MSLWVRLVLMGPVVYCYEQAAYSGANFPPSGAWWPKQLGTTLNYHFFGGPPHGADEIERPLKLLWESGYKGVYADDASLQSLMEEIGFTFGYKPSSVTTYSTDHMTNMETFYVTTMDSATPVLLWNSASWDTAAKTLQLYRLKKGLVEAYSWETQQHATIRELCYLGYILDTSATEDTTWLESVASQASETSIGITAANTTCKNYTDINTGAVTAMYNAPFMKYVGLLNTSTAIFGGGQTGKMQEDYLLQAGVRVILNIQHHEDIPLLNRAISGDPRATIDSSRFVNWTSCDLGGVDDSCPDTDPTVNYESNNADKYGSNGKYNSTKQSLEKDSSISFYYNPCCSDWNLAETYDTAIAAFRKANELGAHIYVNCAVGYRGVAVPLAYWGLFNDKESEELMIRYEEAGYHEFSGMSHSSSLFSEAQSKSWCGSLETGDICTDAAVFTKVSISLTLVVTFLIQAI